MIYCVTGSNKARRALAERAIVFADRRLNFPENADIVVHLTRARLDDDAYGFCDYRGTYYRRHKIDIEIQANLCDSEFVSTIFHELKHAEQYCNGDLSECTTVWRGRDFSNSNAYWSLPWEVSARGFESRLLSHWFYEEC